MNAFKLMLAGLLFGVPLLGVAATDGDLDETSTGTAVVELVIGNVLKLSDVDDLKFGRDAKLGDTIQDDLCVFSNIKDAYKVSIEGAVAPSGGHHLPGPGDSPLLVHYFWSDDGGDNFKNIGPLFVLSSTGSSEHLDCDGVSNAIIQVQLVTNLDDFLPGLYTDTITITIMDGGV